MLALLDGDCVVYEAGFGSDAAAKAKVMESLGGNKERYEAYVQEHGKPFEPLEFCLHNVKRVVEKKVRDAGASRVRTFLSHPVNYREQMYDKYKANRDHLHKPHWYEEIREYLLERWDAEWSAMGDEADDALGIAQMEARKSGNETIIVSKDKDLDMIPGWHFNWSKTREQRPYFMKDPECLRAFYAQILTGDTADNIPGMFKHMGRKAEQRWLVPLETMTREQEMYKYVTGVYKGDTEFVHMVGKLLWIKRDGEWWSPPT